MAKQEATAGIIYRSNLRLGLLARKILFLRLRRSCQLRVRSSGPTKFLVSLVLAAKRPPCEEEGVSGPREGVVKKAGR
jgi:hypothetical protein